MRNMQTLKGNGRMACARIAKAFALALVAGLLLVLPGCQNPTQSPNVAERNDGTGTLSLSIGRQDLARTPTVRPPALSLDTFSSFELAFTPRSAGAATTITWGQGVTSGEITLSAGTWDLLITAFVGDDRVAQGSLTNFWVSAGEIIDGNVVLAPIPFHATNFPHRGELYWDIRHDGVDLNLARMDLTRVDVSPAQAWGSFFFVGGLGTPTPNPGYRPEGLESGQYRVVITLRNTNNDLAVVTTIVHIYRGMTSTLDFAFTSEYFQTPLLDTILGLWDLEDDLQVTFANVGITAGHFAHLGVNGVNADNLEGLVYWFDVFRDELTPTTLAGLRTLVDVARLGVYSQDEDFLGVAHEHRGAVTVAISALRSSANGNNTTITRFRWRGARTVEVEIAGVMVEFEFANDIPVGMRVPYTTLAPQLAWLRTYSQAGNTYLVEIAGTEDITSAAAALPNRAITVVLTGLGAGGAHVSLTGTGFLFNVHPSLTMELGNVTLHGTGSNTAPLIQVSGTLIMREGSTVRGNTRSGGNGGGVNVASGGRFILDGGTISSNSATGGWNGGGVNVASGGIFRMVNGVIFGNNAGDNSNTVTATNGAALNVVGTAQRGTFDPDGEFGEDASWQQLGTLTTTNATIHVEDGEMVRPYGENLAAWLAWLQAFVQTGGTYDIELSDDENIPAQTLAFGTRTNITINLTGSEEVTIGLSSNGSLGIGSGVTLGLGENITLLGRGPNGVPGSGNNTNSLVTVASGGRLIMGEGSTVRGNHDSWGNGGGGVNVASGGRFILDGGTIASNNTTWNGGGVHIASGGIFRMVNGVIFGNNAGDDSNAASSNASLNVAGTAQRGIFDPDGEFGADASWRSSGTLPSTNATIHVEEGEMVRPFGENLVAWLAWLQAFAQTDGTYDIELNGDESIVAQTLAFTSPAPARTNITINLTGSEDVTIGLSSATGSLFTVGSGITLGLGENITLLGRGPGGVPDSLSNNQPLVVVNGTLVMSDDSEITGNANNSTTAGNVGGGVRVNSGGTFVMFDDAVISGNASTGWNGDGGGVHIASGGTFNMRGGTISGNNSGRSGGGVSNAATGTFRISDGVIEANTAVTGTSVSGTSALGTFSGAGVFTPAGWTLPATVNAPVRIGNGVWIGETYTILFLGNGGTGTVPSMTVPVGLGSSITLPGAGGLLRPDFIFIGWNTAPDGSGTNWNVGSSFTPGGDAALFARWMPVGDIPDAIPVLGATFDAQWSWLTQNSQPGGYYLIVVTDDPLSVSRTLPAGRTVILRGGQPNTTIGLSSGGVSLFAIGSGSTLMLGENITLLGRGSGGVPSSANNTQPLVRVDNSGTLIMNQGSRISGNTNAASADANMGGGVRVNSGGTFHMFDGAVISVNTASMTGHTNGGGVNVASAGTFNMRGGRIYGNVSTAGSAGNGGGVFVAAGGTFRISDGVIYGNEVEHGGYRNTATHNGASLHGTASVGTFDGAGLFVESTSWTLSTANGTINVEGGIWQGETFTVTFDSNGGTGTVLAPITIPASLGASIMIPSVGKLSNGEYFFAGWNTAADGTGTSFSAGTNFVPTGNVTLYAIWSLSNVPGATFAAQLSWLQTNAQTGGRYYIELGGNVSQAPHTLSFSGRSDIVVTLRGGLAIRTISLPSNGALFAIGSGVTLVLGENITLEGRNGNNSHLVRINSGGNLVLNAGSRITGNNNTTSGSDATDGGGVRVNGTLTMNYGAIISGNGSDWLGGGVTVSSGGVFNMLGGEIYGNRGQNGGGINNAGTVRISDGTINGNEVALPVAQRNTAGTNAALAGTAAQRGTFNNGIFTQLSTIAATNLTIRVVDGILQ